MINKEFICW